MVINLLNNYILVERIEEENKEGFQAVSAVNELIGKGKCIAIDPQQTEINPSHVLGKTIYFEKSLGTEFEVDGKKIKFIKIEDVMGYE